MIILIGIILFTGLGVLMSNCKSIKGLIIIFVISIFSVIAVTYYLFFSTKPKATNMNKGNTELKVTYEIVGNDTIPIDSVVIYKSL